MTTNFGNHELRVESPVMLKFYHADLKAIKQLVDYELVSYAFSLKKSFSTLKFDPAQWHQLNPARL